MPSKYVIRKLVFVSLENYVPANAMRWAVMDLIEFSKMRLTHKLPMVTKWFDTKRAAEKWVENNFQKELDNDNKKD